MYITSSLKLKTRKDCNNLCVIALHVNHQEIIIIIHYLHCMVRKFRKRNALRHDQHSLSITFSIHFLFFDCLLRQIY